MRSAATLNSADDQLALTSANGSAKKKGRRVPCERLLVSTLAEGLAFIVCGGERVV